MQLVSAQRDRSDIGIKVAEEPRRNIEPWFIVDNGDKDVRSTITFGCLT